jgi:hypothetical protein
VSKLDRDGDGDFDTADLHLMADEVISRTKACSRCGKILKKKSKYQTGVCVDCYRNPTNDERCVAETANRERCKRRRHEDSIGGYCGIHVRKYEAQ